MKPRHFLAAVVLAVSSPLAAQSSGPVRVQVDAMPTSALVTMLMRDVMQVPFVISPDVLADSRPVSVNLTLARQDLPVGVVQFLRGIGLSVEIQGGTVYVTKPGGASSAFQSAFPAQQLAQPVGVQSVTSPAAEKPPALLVVRLAHRSVEAVGAVIEAAFPGVTVASKAGSAPKGEQVANTPAQPEIVLSGDPDHLERARLLILSLDKPLPLISVRAVVVEIRTDQAKSSALSVLASVLGGRFQAGSLADAPQGSQFARIALGGFQATLSAVRSDGRFKVVAEPSLTGVSGSLLTVNSGAQVPTIGSVSYDDQGRPIRSISYRDSGVSFSVRPTALNGGSIELDLIQERSTFSRTVTGVDETPTLNKSTATGRVALLPGESVVFAALDERAENDSKQGLFGGLLGAKSKSVGTSQLVLVVTAELVPSDKRDGAPTFYAIGYKPSSGV